MKYNPLSRLSYVSLFLWMMTAVFAMSALSSLSVSASESVRKERRLIKQGNSLYNQKKYREAARLYNEALQVNPESAIGRFNLGMSQMRQGMVADTTRQTQEILSAGLENLSKVAALGMKNPKVSSFANYNLGNVAFNKQDYAGAIGYYKQALRLNPSDDNARRNLRIAQLKQQQNDNNKDDNKNQEDKNNDNKDQDKNNQDKNNDSDKNKDQNQNKQNQDKQNQDKQNDKDISKQTADQILRAVENKENQVRNRVMRGQGSGQGRENAGRGGGRKNW
ncbi:MAG: tetratricopeptide repeat protein [Bacteroidales bacterium]|nr:tetratricopeptide repeat protein [Bacteroidales bacterium]